MARPRTATDLQVSLDRSLAIYRVDVRRLLDRAAASGAVRDRIVAERSFDDALWLEVAALEWAGGLIPETCGGAGGSLLEATVLMEELGRTLVPLPLMSSGVLGALALVHGADDAARADLLPQVASGRLRATLAHDRTTCVAALSDEHRLTGTLHGVIDGAEAELVLAWGTTTAGARALVAVAPSGPGVAVTREVSVDPTRRLSTIALEEAPVRMLAGKVDDGALRRVEATCATLVAAEATGGARRCLELASEWAALREQFGRPIGTFQAIKHACVDMLVDVEAATAAMRLAARLGDAGSTDHAAAASLALATCLRGYRRAAERTMQVLGGMGYTWDHDVHLHLKRAKGCERLFGSPTRNELALADALGR